MRKFNAQGNELAVIDKGFKFPNQISFHNGKLLVADTNHHEIQIVNSETESFGEIQESHSIVNPALNKNVWPYSFAKVGWHWWVNSMDGSMSNGVVAIYDEHWQFVKTVNLPEDADPFDFAVLDKQMLITDLNNNRIYQLDFQGQTMSNSLPAEITVKLEQLQKTRSNYIYLSYAAVGLFAVFLITGFFVGIVQARSQQELIDSTRSESLIININNPEIKWVSVNRQKIGLLKVVMLTPLVFVLVAMMQFETGTFRMSLYFAMLLIIIALALAFQLFSKKIGTLGDVLIIKKYNKHYAAGKDENIFFSDTRLLIDTVHMPFIFQQQFFNTEQIVKEVMPLLRNATYVSPGQMMNMMLKRQNPMLILLVFLLAMVSIVILMLYGIKQ